MNIKDAQDAFTNKDYERALKIYKSLADSGEEEAIFGLAHLYENGFGVIQNKRYAASLFKKYKEIL